MNKRKFIRKNWRELGITVKFGILFGTVLVLMVLIGITGYAAFTAVRSETETAIVTSTRIQYLVLDMDRHLKEARRLGKDFFLRYPTVGYADAYKTYAQQAQKQIIQVRALSAELKNLISESDVSGALRQTRVNLSLYTAAAERYAATVEEAADLVARLASDKAGLQARLAQQSSLLKGALQIGEDPGLMALYRKMQSFEKDYWLTRQRPLMQSAINVAIPLRPRVKMASKLDADQKAQALSYLDEYLKTAEQIPQIDASIRGKFNEFDLQTEAIDPVSQGLIALAKEEIERASSQIHQTSRLATVILVIAVLIGIALVSIIASIFNSSITHNVIKLTQATQEFQTGNMEVRSQIDSGDELGQLADAFNAMATRITAFVGSLEQRVSERTAQLTKTNEQLKREITERKQAQDALKESEEKYRSMMEAMGEAVYICSQDYRVEYMNPAMVKRTGWDATGELCYKVINELDEKCPWCVYEKVLEGESFETEIVSPKDGRSYNISHSPIFHEDGSISKMTIFRDITERKQAEEALRERTRDLAERVKELNCLYGISNLVEKPNISLEEIFQGVVELISPSWQYPEITCSRIILEDKEYKTENFKETNLKQFQEIFVHGNMAGILEVCYLEEKIELDEGPFLKEERNLIIAIAERLGRIIEHKQVQEALRESQERLSSFMDSATDGFILFDLELNYIDINKSALEMTGLDRKEFIGKNVSDVVPNLKETGRYDKYKEVIKTGEPLLIPDLIPHPKFGIRHVELKAFKVGDGLGIIFTDITDRVQAEEEKRRLEDQLHQAQKMEALGLMAGAVAHDLNNILSGIVTIPELLLMDLPEESPLKKPIEVIRDSGKRAVDVVADLMTITRGVATGKEVWNLNIVAGEYLISGEHTNLEKMRPSVVFKTELDRELLNITCSPTHIKKSLMNLVTNASEAIGGGGTVTISTTNRYLDEPLKGYEDVRIGEYTVLSVSDDGPGISPEDLERIFEPFYTKKVMGKSGTGLGLTIVWNTVQDHNGYIDVRTGERGTVFDLYFLVTRDELTQAEEEVPPEDYQGHGEKILVVDDEEKQREIACWLLARLGYVAEAVSSGEEAIEYVKENSVDLIVLDMVMPKGINGRETYEEIIKIRPGQKAIIASGYAKTKEVDMAQELGAGKYIKKPYTLQKVGLAVKEELEK